MGAYRIAPSMAPSLRRRSQFFGSPSRCAGTSVQTPSSRSPSRRTVETAVTLLLDQLVRAAIPDLDGPGAVLAGRDRALEVAVLERMILDVNGEMPLAAPQRNALRHRPARQRAVSLETKVVVQPTSVVALDDEAGLRRTPLLRAERLGRLPGAALPAVFVERHLWIVAINATLSSPTGEKFGEIPAQRLFRLRG